MTSARTFQEVERREFVTAMRHLKDAQKSSKGAPAYSLYVNRPLGRIFAAVAYKAGLTPDQVTMISAASTFAGIAIVALTPMITWVGVLVGFLLVVGYALDSADGQLARLLGGGTKSGEWLDHIIDSGKIVCLHLAVLLMMTRELGLSNRWLLLVRMVFAVVSTVHFFGMILSEQLVREHRARLGLAAAAKKPASRIKTLLKIPTDYGVLCLAFLLIGAPSVFFGVYSVLALGSAGYLLLILPKWRKDIVALDTDSDA